MGAGVDNRNYPLYLFYLPDYLQLVFGHYFAHHGHQQGPVADQADGNDGNDAHGVDQGDNGHIVLIKINKLNFEKF